MKKFLAAVAVASFALAHGHALALDKKPEPAKEEVKKADAAKKSDTKKDAKKKVKKGGC